MKTIVVSTFLLLCFMSINAQLSISVTDDLTAAQEDLGTSHKFTETAIFMSRIQVSLMLDQITLFILDSHIQSFAFIRDIGLNVTDVIDAIQEIPQNQQCINNLRNRWDLKITRYGILLSDCVSVVQRVINSWNNFINSMYEEGQQSRHFQNIGVRVLAETSDFVGRNRLSANIYRYYQETLDEFLEVRNSYEDFLQQLTDNFEEAVTGMVECDRMLEENAVDEQIIHLNMARDCENLS